eukprot:COSAG01_NODE_5103_length_4481_cov_13.715883_8_plen_30_part_00
MAGWVDVVPWQLRAFQRMPAESKVFVLEE